jgi:hypothetical protein
VPRRLLVLALVASIAASCSSTSEPAAAPRATTTSTTLPAPPATGAELRSPVVVVRGMPTVLESTAVASATGATGRLDVQQWRSRWQVVRSLPVDPPGVLDRPDPDRPLVVRDVTGDGVVDFVAPLMAASTSPYEVISDDGGDWRAVPFAPDGHTIVLEPDEPSATSFITNTRLCDPDCATGGHRRDEFRYSHDTRRFEVVRSAVCGPPAGGRIRCEPATWDHRVPIHRDGAGG